MVQHTNSTSKDVALDLARRGIAVFPCHYIKPGGTCSCGTDCGRDAGKHPMTHNGFKDAAVDPAAVERLFRGSRSSANIAVATGPVSGVWVLDVEAAGLPILDQLQQQHGTLPTTVSSITGGGGKHLWFKWNGIEVKNRTKINGEPIDCRGAGGYVVVPPSNHKSGRRYRWEHDPETTPIVEAPSWLTQYVAGTNGSTKPAETITTPAAGGLTFTVAAPVEDLATAAGAGEGQRHATALRLIGGAIGRGTDPVEVARQAAAWAARCSPPLDDQEVLRIVGDFARKQTTQHKPAAAIAAKPIPTPPPPWVPFPIKAIPTPIRSYITGSAAAIGCDPAFVATAILPTLAAAIGNSRTMLLKRGWAEPAVLWGGLVGDSGCQKSPALDAATKHTKHRQAVAVEAHRQDQEEYDKQVEAYKLSYDDWKRTGRKKGDPPPVEPIKPICDRFTCSDITVEGLAERLADAHRGLLLIRDELAGWFGSFDQYKPGHGADAAHWLTIHGARDLLVDRKTGDRKTLFVRRAAVSITGGIQPGTLRRALGTEHFENGLAARLLLAMPPRRAKRWTEARVGEDLDRQVGEIFDRLYQLQPEDQDQHPEPVVVGLTQDGKAAWVEFYDRHAERIADASGNEAAVLSKIEAAAARIALVLHLVRQAAFDPDAGEAVDAASIRSGVTIAEWYASEAERVYRVLRETDEDRSRREVVELITRRGGTITANELRKRSRRLDTNEEAEVVLAGLVRAGIGTWEHVPTGDAGGRPTTQFRLSGGVSETETPANTGKSGVLVSETAGAVGSKQWEVTEL